MSSSNYLRSMLVETLQPFLQHHSLLIDVFIISKLATPEAVVLDDYCHK